MMGDIADMVIEGILCESCGVYIEGDAPGYPRSCSDCILESMNLIEEEERNDRPND